MNDTNHVLKDTSYVPYRSFLAVTIRRSAVATWAQWDTWLPQSYITIFSIPSLSQPPWNLFFSFKINTDPSSILSQAVLLQLACLPFLLSLLVLKAWQWQGTVSKSGHLPTVVAAPHSSFLDSIPNWHWQALCEQAETLHTPSRSLSSLHSSRDHNVQL